MKGLAISKRAVSLNRHAIKFGTVWPITPFHCIFIYVVSEITTQKSLCQTQCLMKTLGVTVLFVALLINYSSLGLISSSVPHGSCVVFILLFMGKMFQWAKMEKSLNFPPL